MTSLLSIVRPLFAEHPTLTNHDLAALIMERHEAYRKTSPVWLRNTVANYRKRYDRPRVTPPAE